MRGPFVGVNTTWNSRRIRTTEAQDALNCDLDGATIRRRSGYVSLGTAPNGAPIEGMHDYRKPDGTRIHLVKAGDSLYSLSGSTFTLIGAGLVAGNIAQFVTAGGKCYIAHGGTPKVTDGVSLDGWQISQPEYAPTLATSETGLLSGTYDYKITFYSSEWGLESPASPPTNKADTTGVTAKTTVVDVAEQWVDLSILPASTDARVDKIRVYRRKISSYERDWFFVEEIPATASSWTDRVPDNSVSIQIAPLSFSAEYPKARLVTANQGVIFVSGIGGDPSSVWYTRPGKTVLVDRLVLDDDGGEVTALREYQGQLLVLTSRSHWLLSGYNEFTFTLRKLIPDRGCLAPFSAVAVDSGVYSLSETGMNLWNGSGVRETSWPVRDLWYSRNFSRDYLIQGVHDAIGNAIWWSYSSAGSSVNDKILVYFIRNSLEVSADSWCPWEISGVTSLEQITDPATNTRRVYLGFSDGRVALFDSAGDDDGAEIEWYWQTGDEDFDTPTRKKAFGELVIETVGSGAGSFDIEIDTDGKGQWEPLGESTPVTKNFRWDAVRRTANQIALKILSDGDAEVISWALEVEASVRT